MQNMSDNELDNLFKEAAEGFVPPQDASAWKQMASMLDKNPVKPASFWNWKTITTVTTTGLIAVTAVWFAATDDRETIAKTNGKNGSNNATQGVVQEQQSQTNLAGRENLSPAQPVENKGGGVHAVSTAESRNDKYPDTKEKSARKGNTHKGDNGIQPDRDTELPATEKSEPAVITSDIMVSHATAPETVRSTSSSGVVEKDLLAATDSAESSPEKTRTDSAENVSTVAEKKDKKSQRGVFSLKAVLSPDFSSVNYFSASKSGINYGLLVGYSFNNRWSVYTGVISSKKLYTTKDVEGSYNLDGYDYPMKELDGDCRILDIPINVYYTFFPERSFSLRAGLGFSSYIMRKESYVYCVDNYGSNAYYEQQVEGENNEWFKVMNLSVAVSKSITNRLSAEFEPFVKAPLAGVGEGKVSLVSMGAFINLKFDVTLNK